MNVLSSTVPIYIQVGLPPVMIFSVSGPVLLAQTTQNLTLIIHTAHLAHRHRTMMSLPFFFSLPLPSEQGGSEQVAMATSHAVAYSGGGKVVNSGVSGASGGSAGT